MHELPSRNFPGCHRRLILRQLQRWHIQIKYRSRILLQLRRGNYLRSQSKFVHGLQGWDLPGLGGPNKLLELQRWKGGDKR